jgi:hypothetical protein
MLLGVLGCNVAWGFIDGVLYLMAILSEKGHNLNLLRKLRRTSDPVEARRIVASALPGLLVSVLPQGATEDSRFSLDFTYHGCR